MGNRPSRDTFLRITNDTYSDITKITVFSVDGYDWATDNRPDDRFKDVSLIKAHQSTKHKLAVYKFAKNCPYTMTLEFEDGSKDTFRVNQKYAINKAAANFQVWDNIHELKCTRPVDEEKTITITVKNTPQQLRNREAEETNKKGKEKMRQRQYEEAVKLFEEASKKANKKGTKDDINRNKAEAYHLYGQDLFQRALDLEAKNKAEEAKQKFNQAREKVVLAEAASHSPKQKKTLDSINLKIEVNKIFNEAVLVEKQASDLWQEAKQKGDFKDCTPAQNKYKQAKGKYEEALKKAREGMKIDKGKFESSVKICEKMVKAVAKVVDDIDKAEFNFNMDQVHVDDHGEKVEEEVNVDVQKQIDA